MEPREWTADIRLTLIGRLAKQLAMGNNSRLEDLNLAARIYNLATQSDDWLNNNYGDVMGTYLPVSARLTWPTMEPKGD